jgi:uncharacterized protein with GYD domain
VASGDLTDAEWVLVGPLLPRERGRPGRPGHENRPILDGILWRAREGARWRAVPERYSEGAIKGMLAKPEDRTAAVAKLFEQAGGKLLGFYLLFGEHDWLVISEMPGSKEAAAAALATIGATTDTKTMLAMTGAEAKAAFEAGQKLGAAYRAPGAS